MPTFLEKTTKRPKLAELCSQLIMLLLHLRASEEFGDETVLRQKINDLFHTWEHKCKRAGIEFDDIQMTKFALVAFMDETIITSNWSKRDVWIANPLQLELYNRFDAGEDFFKRLDELRQRSKVHTNVLEVYYLCMALGFEGMFQLRDREKLRWIIEDTYNELRQISGRSSEQLSPHGFPSDEIVETVKNEIPLWIIGVVATGFFIFIYLILTFFINSKADSAKNVIEGFI